MKLGLSYYNQNTTQIEDIQEQDEIMNEMAVTHDVREKKNAYTVLVGKPGERGHLEDPGVDWRMTLNWILNRMEGGE